MGFAGRTYENFRARGPKDWESYLPLQNVWSAPTENERGASNLLKVQTKQTSMM